MHVSCLFIKTEHHKNGREHNTLTLRRGYGVEGDINAIAGSPRQVLLVGMPTLDRLALHPGQLQENILVSTAIEAFTSGQILQLGQDALVRLMFLCEPCAALEKIQPGLAKKIKGRRGFLGMVVRDGVIQTGDAIAPVTHRFPAIPETLRGKFEEFVARIPLGRVVPTSDLLLALGLTRSYFRSIPTLLKRSPAHLPLHRIVAADGSLMTRHLPHQPKQLLVEGIEVRGDRVPQQFFWEPSWFHDLGRF